MPTPKRRRRTCCLLLAVPALLLVLAVIAVAALWRLVPEGAADLTGVTVSVDWGERTPTSATGGAADLVQGDALNVYISGSAGTCTVGGSARLVPTISGFCEDGIVWLTTYEEWQDHQMAMACNDGAARPFELPDMG